MSGTAARHDPNYKWVALSNTTLGVLMAAIDGSIVIISLPAIFNGIHLDPLDAGNVSYLLWIFMGYLLVTAVLVVAFGWLGDRYGRVRMYNAGFAIFTVGSLLLAATPFNGSAGALWIIGMRIVQGIGGAFLYANSAAILTDASRSPSAAWPSGSTAWPPSPASSSASSPAGSWRPSSGGWSSSSVCRSASLEPSGRTCGSRS